MPRKPNLILITTDQNGKAAWREWLHCEHNTGDERGWQCVTDGREKYIWFHHTGEEQFFDLGADPGETVDLSRDPSCVDRIALWRERLAGALEERGDTRGRRGCLFPLTDADPADPALSLTPNYTRWKERGTARLQAMGR